MAFFKMFHDPDVIEAFKRKCFYTPYSRKIYLEYRDTWQQQTDPLERIYRWFVTQRMAFGGYFGKVVPQFAAQRNKAEQFKEIVDLLDDYVNRLRYVQIEHDSWQRIIKRYDTPDTVFYLDPPYLPSTRAIKEHYPHEMSELDHHRVG